MNKKADRANAREEEAGSDFVTTIGMLGGNVGSLQPAAFISMACIIVPIDDKYRPGIHGALVAKMNELEGSSDACCKAVWASLNAALEGIDRKADGIAPRGFMADLQRAGVLQPH